MTNVNGFVPTLRTDLLRREIDGETIIWSPLAPEPTVLDPISAVMLEVIDGDASVDQIASEVHEEVGIALETAQKRVTDVVERFAALGLLTSSTSTMTAQEAIGQRDLFVSPCTSCMENAARGMGVLGLRFGSRSVGIACDARRGVRRLREALAEHVDHTATEPRIGFVLTAPAGLQRTHHLADRSGFVLSEGRGLDAGLNALAAHLTAFLSPPVGTIRVRASVVEAAGRSVVCVFPTLFAPQITDRDLTIAGCRRVDRLVIDVESASGQITSPDIPWQGLGRLHRNPAHLGSQTPGEVSGVLTVVAEGQPPLGRAAVVCLLAAGALSGERDRIVDGLNRLVAGSAIHSAEMNSTSVLKSLTGFQ